MKQEKKDEKVKGPEWTRKFVEALKHWQQIERESINSSTEVMEKTDNLLVRQVMEIIRNDSVQHHRVQQFIIDSLTTTPIHLRPEELAEIWDQIQKHDDAEKAVIELGKKLREGCNFVQKTLLDYLIYDEQKHDMLLGELEKFKSKLYPYG